MLPPMTRATSNERRRHLRHAGDRRYLEVAGHPARLLDWSFSGLGAELEGGVADLAVGQAVELRTLRKDEVTWATLSATIRRIEPDAAIVGVELVGDNDQAMAILLELLGHRLHMSAQPR